MSPSIWWRKFLARVVVIVLAGIRPADDHHDELAVVEDLLVAGGRPQFGAVRCDPLRKVEGCQGTHVGSIR